MCGPGTFSTGRARVLRRRSTRAEAVLWRHLRDRQLADFKFVRQEPIGSYLADFACRDLRLVIEVDGGQHADSATDGKRDVMMRKLGYRTIRVWNNDVPNNIEGVLQILKAELEIAPHPAPLPVIPGSSPGITVQRARG